MRNSFVFQSCNQRLIMQGFVQIGACVLLLAGLATCNPVGDCPPANPENYHMPDDSDCTVFYKCANGVPVKFGCPAPLHFNPTISVCDWPENAGCAAGGGPTSGTTDPPTCSCTCPSPGTTGGPSNTPTGTTGGPSNTPTGNPTGTPTETPPTHPPTSGPTSAPVCDAIGTCPVYTQDSDTVLLPHRTRCDVYCRCNHGSPIEMPCAPGTWFNAALQLCDWPANSGCVEGQGPTSPPATTKPTAAPSGTTSTGNPTGTPTGNPTGTPTGNPTPTSGPTSAPVCDAIGTCPVYTQDSDTVLLPHRTRCDVYCRCNHGSPIEMPCAPGTWFNAALQLCDWPANSGCVEGQGPTSPPATTKPTSPPDTTKPTAGPTSSTTVAPPKPSCDAVGTCPIYDQNSDTVLLPHRTRCDVYCRCDHGEPVEMPCGAGTYFNAVLQVCDWPADSGCTPSK